MQFLSKRGNSTHSEADSLNCIKTHTHTHVQLNRYFVIITQAEIIMNDKPLKAKTLECLQHFQHRKTY